MANKHMKRHSSLAIREMQIKTTMRYHFSSNGLGIIKTIIMRVGEDVEKLGPSYIADGNVVQPLLKTIWWFLRKSNVELLYETAIPLKRNKNMST